MFLVQLIRPHYLEGVEESIVCDLCSLSYSVQDYSTLFNARKIAYFYSPEEKDVEDDISFEMIMCNVCVFKYLQKTTHGEEAHLLIVDDDKTYNLVYTPEDLDKGPPFYFDFPNKEDEEEDNDDPEDDSTNDLEGGEGWIPPPHFK